MLNFYFLHDYILKFVFFSAVTSIRLETQSTCWVTDHSPKPPKIQFTSKSSHLRSCNKGIFGIFCSKNILKIIVSALILSDKKIIYNQKLLNHLKERLNMIKILYNISDESFRREQERAAFAVAVLNNISINPVIIRTINPN